MEADWLYNFIFWVSTIAFALTIIATVYFVLRYRKSVSPEPQARGKNTCTLPRCKICPKVRPGDRRHMKSQRPQTGIGKVPELTLKAQKRYNEAQKKKKRKTGVSPAELLWEKLSARTKTCRAF